MTAPATPAKSSNATLGIFAAIAAAYLLLNSGGISLPNLPDWLPIPGKSSPATPVDVRFPAPTPELQAAVAPITAHLKTDPAQAAEIAGTYEALANLIERQPEMTPTTAAVHALFQTAVKWKGGRLGPPKTLDVVKPFMLAQLGENKPTPMDPALRAKAVAAYRAVAWAAKEAT